MRRFLIPRVVPAAPQPLLRYRRMSGRPYVADVVERVRELIEGTTLPEAAIAARVGIGVATVHGWKVRRGWRRPDGASLSTRAVGIDRAGFTRRVREALVLLEALAEREAQRLQDRDAAPTAVRRMRAVAEAARRARRSRRRESGATR